MKLYLSSNPRDTGDGLTPAKPMYAGGGQIDTILGGYWRNGVEGLEVKLGPGTYPTLGNANYVGGVQEPQGGWQGWRCRSGWKISGAGPNLTHLKITQTWLHYSDPNINGCTGISSTYSDNQDITVERLSVDCNTHEIGNNQSNISGVTLYGSGHTISRVNVYRPCGRSTTAQINENFPIHIACNSRESKGNLIESCKVLEFAGGTGGKITISNNNNNGNSPITWTSGVVRNCTVIGSQIGFGGWGMKSVVFENCRTENCNYGVNIDSNRNEAVVIEDCKFIGCIQYGIVAAAATGWKINRNTIDAPIPVQLIGDVGWLWFVNNKVKPAAGWIKWRDPHLASKPILVAREDFVDPAVPRELVAIDKS
jgi:hypothetical protein